MKLLNIWIGSGLNNHSDQDSHSSAMVFTSKAERGRVNMRLGVVILICSGSGKRDSIEADLHLIGRLICI